MCFKVKALMSTHALVILIVPCVILSWYTYHAQVNMNTMQASRNFQKQRTEATYPCQVHATRSLCGTNI